MNAGDRPVCNIFQCEPQTAFVSIAPRDSHKKKARVTTMTIGPIHIETGITQTAVMTLQDTARPITALSRIAAMPLMTLTMTQTRAEIFQIVSSKFTVRSSEFLYWSLVFDFIFAFCNLPFAF
jgi:hypothetical protein